MRPARFIQVLVAGAFCLVVWPSVGAGQVQLEAESVTVDAAGDVADLCVDLDANGAEVAGTQNDLSWDGRCATLPSASSCRVNPATGKMLQGGFPPQFDFTYRALVLSLSDVDPIPDGELYCCRFVVEAAPGACCPVAVVRAGAADSRGNALPASGNTAQLCVRRGGGTPVPTATAVPGGDGDDGCQTAAPAGGGVGPAWLLLVVVLALRRARP